MRRIKVFTNPDVAKKIGQILSSHEISFTIDAHKETDWKSDLYGESIFSLYIENENDIERALAALEEGSFSQKEIFDPSTLSGPCENCIQNYLQQRFRRSFATKKKNLVRSSGFCTVLIFSICIGLFFIDSAQNTPASSRSEIQKTLLFDYPVGLETYDALMHDEQSPSHLQKQLLSSLKKTPIFGGLYNYLLEKKSPSDLLPKNTFALSSMGEKIRQGEAWRFFSPCLLHGDIFHLAFNMIWLLAIGLQVEKRLHPFRFLFLVSIIALLSNLAQYCMSGPNFLGISGVLFGLIGFIAKRNELFPWEGYNLRPQAFSYILFFMWSLAFLSFVSFLSTWYLQSAFPISFANTAHITGLFVGLSLGKLSFFSAKKNRDIV